MMARATPSQTVGPFFRFGLVWLETNRLTPQGTGAGMKIHGRLLDADGVGVPDGLLEVHQADHAGRFGTATEPGWLGFGRILTTDSGDYAFETVKPGRVRSADGTMAAPHIDVSVFARGLLQRLVTRIYFPDEVAANRDDLVLSRVSPARRGTLVAHPDGAHLRFDVHLRGDTETVFFNC
jgi:protocatechuate 3,4-dioxygenase alpha subunit